MPVYKVELLGRSFKVEASDMGKAQGMARLYVARQKMLDATNAAAMETRAGLSDAALSAVDRGESEEAPPNFFEAVGRNTTFGRGLTPEEARKASEEHIPEFAAAAALTSLTAPGLVSGMIHAPLKTGTGLVTGYYGSKMAGGAGRDVGHVLENLGAPKGTAATLETTGNVAGGIGGAVGGARVLGALHTLRGAVATPVERAVLETVARRAAAGEVPAAAQAAETVPAAMAPAVAEEAKAATIAAARAAREAKAAELVAKARAVPAPAAATESIQPLPDEAAISNMQKVAVGFRDMAGKMTPAQRDTIRQWIKSQPREWQDQLTAVFEGATRTAQATAGQQVSDAHRRLMQFAKEAATKSKLNEKIWLELDAEGSPVRVLTPDQAGAAARAGKHTTWVKNLWN